jgi:ribosome-binding protein aMBF1 (putative translation factor)
VRRSARSARAKFQLRQFEPDDEERRLAARERLLLEATEAVCKALDERGMSWRELATALGVRPA